MTQILKTAVCVVGAGPAGSTASLFLSKYNIPHVLLDRETFPRDKVCGEAFSGRVQSVLNELNPAWATEIFEENVVRVTRSLSIFLHPAEKETTVQYAPTDTPVLKAKRYVFDNWLLQKAIESPLCTYQDKLNISVFEKKETGVLLSDKQGNFTVEADIVLLCTGENLPLLTRLFPTYPTNGLESVFLRRYYAPRAETPVTQSRYEFHFYFKPYKYLLLINHLPDNTILTEVGLPKKLLKAYNISMESLLNAALSANESLKARFPTDAIIPGTTKGVSMLLGKSPRKLSDERFLLVGSALGSIHPLTGYGVGHAMRSAQLAAACAAESVAKGNFSADFLRRYDSSVARSMRTDLLLGRCYAFVLNYVSATRFGGIILSTVGRIALSNVVLRVIYAFLKRI